MNIKKINSLLIICLIIWGNSITHIYSDTNKDNKTHNILLINSYDIDNEWEN